MHFRYHESDHVLNIAYNILCGGTRLDDIAWLRHDVASRNGLDADLIPDPTTAGNFTRRFSETDMVTLMKSIHARRPKLWSRRGAEGLGPITYLDIDGTIAPTGVECQEGSDISYKGIWGNAPLILSVANTKEVLSVINPPGKGPSPRGAPRLCIGGDKDFSLTTYFDWWAERADFIFGMDNQVALRTRAEALSEEGWRRLARQPTDAFQTGATRELLQKKRAGTHGQRTRVTQPTPQLRGCGRVCVSARPVLPPVSRGSSSQEHQQDEKGECTGR